MEVAEAKQTICVFYLKGIMGCAVVRCKGGPQVIQCGNMASRRGHNRVHSIKQLGPGDEMESSSGVQHVDEAGEQPTSSSSTAALVGQPVPIEDEESRFTFKCEYK